MSSEPPPNPQVSTFNPAFWNITADNGITTQFLDANYLKFPFSQSAVETFVVSPQCSATQPAPTDSSNKIPTTAWVQSAIGTGSVPNLQGVLNLGNTATGASAKIGLTDTGIGNVANPQLTLNNSNATAGAVNGVPCVEYYKSGRNATTGDTIATQTFQAKNATGSKTEYARLETAVRGTGVGNDDGSLGFYCATNSVLGEVFRMNGADNENNSFRPLDLNGNALKTSTGNLDINTASSTGTGTITLTPKTGAVVDIAGNATLTGTRQITFGGGTNITDTISQAGLTITNQTAFPDNTQSIYQDANCNLTQIETSTNSQYFNTNTPQNQTIRRIDLTTSSELQKNQSTLDNVELNWNDGLGDQSQLILDNDFASKNNSISQFYQSPTGNIQTIIQSVPTIQKIQQIDGINNWSATYYPIKIDLVADSGATTTSIKNKDTASENRIDFLKNQGGGISCSSGIVNNNILQRLYLTNADNALAKSINIQTDPTGNSGITHSNTRDGNPFSITTDTDLVVESTKVGGSAQFSSVNGVQITGNGGINLLTTIPASAIGFQTDGLTFTGASLEDTTSTGSSGKYLKIVLNGVSYKIALDNP